MDIGAVLPAAAGLFSDAARTLDTIRFVQN
jgi:hypothetical protein